MKWKNKYSNVISIIFFLFFCTPILSPSIMGLTVYIHWFIPFLDFNFYKYLINIKIKKKYIIFSIIFLFISIFLTKFRLILEILFLVESVIYLIYCFKNKYLKNLMIGININIIIAIIQFILCYINHDWAVVIGPTNISKLLWGDAATLTYTNMNVELWFYRVSGWSREAGFFSSLIIISGFIYHFVDLNIKKTKLQYILFLVAFIISLSKISFITILLLLIILLKKYIDLIPYYLMTAFIITFGILFSNHLYNNNYYNKEYTNFYETFAHRFSGYTIMTQMDLKDLVLGIDNINDLPNNIRDNNQYLENIERFNEFCGIPNMIIHYGIVIFIIYIVGLHIIGYKSSSLAFLTLTTMTVNYTTLTSFVVLTYFFLYLLENKNKETINKILIVNDFLTYGGAELYALNLKKILKEKKYNTSFLTFDNQFEDKIKKFEDCKDFYNIKTSNTLINKLFFNPILYIKIKLLLIKTQPDLIIINNIFVSPITQLISFKEYDAIQVIHDYGIICPKSTCICNGKVCNGYKFNNCKQNCTYHNSKRQLLIKLYFIKLLEILRKKYIRKFISPSKKLNQHLIEFKYDSCCINNPIEETNKSDSKKIVFEEKKYIYVGNISKNKGIYEFMDAFSKFSKNYNVSLIIIGKPHTKNDLKKLNNKLEKCDKIRYIGSLSNQKVREEIENSFCFVAPSFCVENYPTTIMEAKLMKTLPIGSDRGGITELIDNKNLLFDITDENSIIKCLKYTLNMKEKTYLKIVDKNYCDILENNNEKKYFDEFLRVINKKKE